MAPAPLQRHRPPGGTRLIQTTPAEDYATVVVGGGAAGAVVAGRLAATHPTLLLEAGPGELPAEVRGPSFTAAMAGGDLLWTDPPYTRGRALGGSAAVNGMVADRGRAADYDPWPLPGWGWTDLLPWFGRVAVPLHPALVTGPLGEALLAADPAAGRALLTRDAAGRRVTAADAYLADGRATVRCGAEVAAVLLDGRRAVGVRLADGTEIGAEAVVLSAGAINTPLLLSASGVAVDGLGEGLQDHLGVALPVSMDAVAAPDAPDIAVVARHGDLQLMAMDRVHGAPGIGVLIGGALRTTTRGRVTPAGIEFTLDDHDRVELKRLYALAVEVLDRPEMRAMCAPLAGSDEPTGRGVYHHAVGTCALGTVVHGDGSVHGYERLYVCDASVIPVLPRAGTMMVTMAVAERLASAVAQRLDRSP